MSLGLCGTDGSGGWWSVPLTRACRVLGDTTSTLKDVFDRLLAKGIHGSMVSIGSQLVYAGWNPKLASRSSMTFAEIINILTVKPNPSKRYIDLVIAAEDDDGADVDIPVVSIRRL